MVIQNKIQKKKFIPDVEDNYNNRNDNGSSYRNKNYNDDKKDEKTIDLSTINVKKAALAWHSLADPDATVRRDGVGTGQLHRHGRNFNPLNEDTLLKLKMGNTPKKNKNTPPPPPPPSLKLKPSKRQPPLPSVKKPRNREEFPKLVDKPFWNSPVYQDKTSNISTPKPYRKPTKTTVHLVDKPFWKDQENREETSIYHEWGEDNQQQQQQQQRTRFDEENPSEQQIQGNSTPEWDQERKNNKQVKGEEEEGNLFDKKKTEESSGWEQEREEQQPQRIQLDKKNEEEMGKLILIIHIEIENDNVQHINVHEYDDPIKLAKNFCDLWKVEPKVEKALVQLIHDEKAKSIG